MGEQMYVLGHPVGHSKSPAMHNAAFAALGLSWRYGFADCARPDDARAFIDGGDWLALNVTMPYKPLALECADVAHAAARLAKGANVLVRCEGRLHGYNVDGAGCVAFLKRSGVDLDGVRVAVCGTGPTSLSIMHACACAGAKHIALLSRTAEKAQAVVDAYGSACASLSGCEDTLPKAEFAALSYKGGGGALSAADVVVDATPLGMTAGDPAPFDTSVLSAGQVVLDVVYGHGETTLAADARKAGCAVYDGSGMLVGQAVETLRVVSEVTGLFAISDDLDLFPLMAQAASFSIQPA